MHIGEVEFDESASIWSVDVGIRIDDPASGVPLGVLKGVLGTSLIQEIADVHAAAIVGGQVTMLTDQGLIVAETATRHATARIMNPDVNLREAGPPAIQNAFTSGQGFELTDEMVTGFAETTPPSANALVPSAGDFGWRVVVDQPATIAFDPLGGLATLQSDLDSSRKLILAMTIGVLFLALLGAIGAVVALTRRERQIARANAELQQAHEAQQRSQRMEMVGELAGGIAHDFNNLLTAILGANSFLMSGIPPHDPLRAEAQEIENAGKRAAALTQQLLAFSSRQVLKPEVLDLNAVVVDMDRMLQRLIGEHIELQTAPAPDLGAVLADPAQLEQVIVNLAVNARDAMPDGGVLTIETSNIEISEPIAPAGEYVMLGVSDTGSGMDEGTRARIFEPFFTTKAPSHGTGLGLATVYGILKQSGGHITVDSEPGLGSTFRAYLPRSRASAPPEAPLEQRALRRGNGTILLVEDEEAVRRVACKALVSRGYRVIDAPNPLEALDAADGKLETIDLLVTDVVMPEMSGPELAARLKEQRHVLEVLFMSGYTDRAATSSGAVPDGAPFLSKPFTPDSLILKVQDILQN